MNKLIICLLFTCGLVFSAQAEDYEKDERIKAEIQKELDAFYHMSFKADLCPIEDVTGGQGGGIPIPTLPWKFGGGHHANNCDGEDDSGIAKIHVKGFFHLRFEVKLKFNINGNTTAAHIHCKVDGGDGPVAATLNPLSVNSNISLPDNGNACGYESFEDLYLAMKMGKTYIVVHSEEKPGGHLKGDIKPKH
jgi:hypothetical protein